MIASAGCSNSSGPADQIVNSVCAVEKGVLGMAVEMYEAHGLCKLAVPAGAGEGDNAH